MEKLTAQNLKNLKHGDIVYQFKGINESKLHFVGKMPNNKNYLIFCQGEHLQFLYINPKTEQFKNDWYGSKLSIEEIGNIIILNIDYKIQYYINQKKLIKEIYVNKVES